MIIYRVFCKVSGKSYIGQTIKILEGRKAQHINAFLSGRNENLGLYEAFKKYGLENFEWTVLEDGVDDRKKLNELEKFWIREFNTLEDGYNLTSGGSSGIHGYKHSPETRAHLSAKLRERWADPESRKKMEEVSKRNIEPVKFYRKGMKPHNFGKPLNENQKNALRQANTGSKRSKEAIEKAMSKCRGDNHWTRRKMTDGHRAILRKNMEKAMAASVQFRFKPKATQPQEPAEIK